VVRQNPRRLAGPPSHLPSTAASSPSAPSCRRQLKNSAAPPHASHVGSALVSTERPPHGEICWRKGRGVLAGAVEQNSGSRLTAALLIQRIEPCTDCHSRPLAVPPSPLPSNATTWASAPACRSRSLGPASTHLLSPIDWSSPLTLVPRTFHLPSFSYLSEFDIEVSAELDREKVLEEPFLVV